MRVAVLGAGHGGQAMAGDLALAGHEVTLAAVPEHSTNLKILEAFGGVFVEGVTSSGAPPGFARLRMTTDVEKAVKDAEVVMVVVPAFAQDIYMRILVEHAESGQIVVFNPGKFGALTFWRRCEEAGRAGDLLIGETSCLLYAAKTKGPGHVHIKAVKSEQPFAAMPSVRTAEALMVLTDLFPQLSPAYNVFQTSLDDPGMVVHSISTLLNMSRIELMGPYRNSHYDITPSVGRVIEAVDAERVAVSRELCRETYSLLDIMLVMYKVKAASVYDGEWQIRAHDVQMAPGDLMHRYVSEEVPYGLVPVSSIGRAIGIPTPGIDALIFLASAANGLDYRTEGRTLESLGIAGLSLRDLVAHVTRRGVARA